MSIHYIKHSKYPDSILIRDFTGDVNVHDIIDSWKYLIENDLITANIQGVINRLIDCELKMDVNSFEILIGYLKEIEILKKVKLAVVSKAPEIIIFPMLGEFKERELKIKPFSTEDAAVKWIMGFNGNE